MAGESSSIRPCRADLRFGHFEGAFQARLLVSNGLTRGAYKVKVSDTFQAVGLRLSQYLSRPPNLA